LWSKGEGKKRLKGENCERKDEKIRGSEQNKKKRKGRENTNNERTTFCHNAQTHSPDATVILFWTDKNHNSQSDD
jgi:hypothetical protein